MKKFTLESFDAMVKKVGGRQKAAEVMGVTVIAVDQFKKHLRRPDRIAQTLGTEKILLLLRAAGELPAPPAAKPGNGAGVMEWMGVDALKQLKTFRFGEVVDGFQRGLRSHKVADIEAQSRMGHGAKLPPILVARLPDGTLIVIDGQHRQHGIIAAGGPGIWAQIVDVASVDEARHMFLLINSRATKVTRLESLNAGKNHQTEVVKSWIAGLKVSDSHALNVAGGLLGRRVDFVSSAAEFEADLERRGEAVLRIWTNSPRWGTKPYSAPRTLKALAILSKDFAVTKRDGTHDIESVLLTLRDTPQTWHKGATLHGYCETATSPRALADAFLKWVTRKLNGGLSPQKAGNRARPR